jgi:hypothetical protein
MYEPLITEELHCRLLNLRNELEAQNLNCAASPPQFGIMPKLETAPRVLLVGKAPGHVESSTDFEQATQLFGKSLEWHMSQTDERSTPFWAWSRYFMNQLSSALESETDGNFPDFMPGWTNLAKIGGPGWEAPGGVLLNRQTALCQELLNCELGTARADAIIFMTGHNNCRRNIQDAVVGDEATWLTDGPDKWVAQKDHPDFGLLIWIDHPQGAQTIMRDLVAETITPQIVGRWRNRLGQA